MNIDTHVHTGASDNEGFFHELAFEASEANIGHVVYCDHANPVDPDKNFPAKTEYFNSDIWPHDNEDIDLDESINSTERIIDIFKTREYFMEEESEDNEFCILAEEYNPGEVPTSYDIALTSGCIQTVMHSGIELDYNPPIEFASNTEEVSEIAESYNQALKNFLDKAEQEGLKFDVLLGSVHDVNIDYEPRYVKKDQKFLDLEPQTKRKVVDDYFTKLECLIESEIFDIVAHPSLIERNDVLMDSISPVQEFRERELKNYYESIIDCLEKSRTITEFNGKGVERQDPPSVFWNLVKEREIPHTRGSDSHRRGEMTSRIGDFERVEDSKRPIMPLLNGKDSKSPELLSKHQI